MNYVGNPPAPAGLVLVGDTNPIGAIVWGHKVPDGSYLQLNGQTVSKTTYPDLWAYASAFLTSDQAANPGLYRSVDASTFAVPVMAGLFLRSTGGSAAALGVKQGYATGKPVATPSALGSVWTRGASGGSNGITFGAGTTEQAANWDAETRPDNVALVPSVKALSTVMMPALAMPPQDVVLLQTKVAATSASLDFTNLVGFASYRFEISNLVPATNTNNLTLRFSTDNGATFIATSDHNNEGFVVNASGTSSVVVTGTTNDAVYLTGGGQISNDSSNGLSGTLWTSDLANNKRKSVRHLFQYYSTAASYSTHFGGGSPAGISVFNAVRFLFSSGSAASGTIRCYGER